MVFRFDVCAFLFGMVLFFPLYFSPSVFGQDLSHTVNPGETFFSIARTHGIRAEDLMRFNGIEDPSRLRAGQRLKIPRNQSSGGEGEFATYRVARGDTFFSLARRFSVSERAIREANKLADSYILREGDSLKIPSVSGAALPAASLPNNLAAGSGTANRTVVWPVRAQEINRMTGRLSGVIIRGAISETVLSITNGTVISIGPYRGFGMVAIVQAEGGYLYVYGGSESLSVREGDKVSPGTEIGRLGIDIVTNQPQLFFMVYRGNTPIDPAEAPRA